VLLAAEKAVSAISDVWTDAGTVKGILEDLAELVR
jgi:hypothetical protein